MPIWGQQAPRRARIVVIVPRDFRRGVPGLELDHKRPPRGRRDSPARDPPCRSTMDRASARPTPWPGPPGGARAHRARTRASVLLGDRLAVAGEHQPQRRPAGRSCVLDLQLQHGGARLSQQVGGHDAPAPAAADRDRRPGRRRAGRRSGPAGSAPFSCQPSSSFTSCSSSARSSGRCVQDHPRRSRSARSPAPCAGRGPAAAASARVSRWQSSTSSDRSPGWPERACCAQELEVGLQGPDGVLQVVDEDCRASASRSLIDRAAGSRACAPAAGTAPASAAAPRGACGAPARRRPERTRRRRRRPAPGCAAGRLSPVVNRTAGRKCVRVLALRRWHSSMPPAGGRSSCDDDQVRPVQQRLLEGAVGVADQGDVQLLLLAGTPPAGGPSRAAGRRHQRFELARAR